MPSDPIVQFRDGSGLVWEAFEILHDRLPGAVLVFLHKGHMRATWGTPINWRDPANLSSLFDLSVELPTVDSSAS
jgi:hypothetical protein